MERRLWAGFLIRIGEAKRKTLNGAKLVKGFYGAPNRIRTCGLLIRSQTLYPAELWVQVFNFLFRVARNENYYIAWREECQYFFSNFFTVFASAENEGFSGGISATFGAGRTFRKSESINDFFLCKNREKPSKTCKRCAGRIRTEEKIDIGCCEAPNCG